MGLMQLLKSGGSLRFRPTTGFYVVHQGVAHPMDQKVAQEAVKLKQVRPNGIDQHGVYLFALNAR